MANGENEDTQENRFLKALGSAVLNLGGAGPKLSMGMTGPAIDDLIQGKRDLGQAFGPILKPVKNAITDPVNRSELLAGVANLTGSQELSASARARADAELAKRNQEFAAAKELEIEQSSQAPTFASGGAGQDPQMLRLLQAMQSAGVSTGAGFDKAMNLQLQGLGEASKAREQGFKEQADLADERQQFFADQAERLNENQEKFREFSQEQEQKIRGFVDEMVNTPPSKTFEQFFAEKTVPQRLIFGLAIAANRDNPAMLNFLQNVVTSDIQAQKDKFAKSKNLVDVEESFYSRARQRFGDERVAEALADAAIKDSLAAKLDGIINQTNSLVERGNLKQQQGVILQSAAQSKAAAMDKLRKNFSDELLSMQVGSNLPIDRARLTPEQRKTFMPLLNDFAADPTEKRDLEKGFSATKKLMGLTDKLISFRKKFGAEKLNKAQLATARQDLTRLQLLLKGPSQFDLGVLAGPDMKLIIQSTFEDPGEIGFVLDRLQNLKQGLIGDVLADLEAKGFHQTPQLVKFLGGTASNLSTDSGVKVRGKLR